MLKFPYGLSDFYRIITNNYFYVDRTSHIQTIEDFGDQLLFLRPHRFGKSLLLSMLENYYDVAKANEFERLFGHLAIGQNPTPMHNQYLVMKWDFSLVKAQGDITAIEKALYDHVNNAIKNFTMRYKNWLKHEIEIDPQNAISSFESLLMVVNMTPHRLYLLIDEYDNFANELMIEHHKENPSRYKRLLSGEGIVKTLFKAVKSGASGRGLERVFVTGVAPVVLSDMSSGYNVATHIYLRREFNDLCGFLEREIEKALTQIAQECDFSKAKVQQALFLMRIFYDGYRFSQAAQVQELIYNPTLALYFLKYFQQDCQFPEQLLDSNLLMDSGKLTYILQLPSGEQILVQALNENPPLSLKHLASGFGVEDMHKSVKDMQFMVSLLYYFGILTLNGKTSQFKMRFKIPNLVIRQLYVERLFENFLPQPKEREQARSLAEDFYQTGNLQPLCEFMEQRYFKAFDNRDYLGANELTIKTAFLTVLFDDTFYIMDSETELERRYADLTMIVRPEWRKSPLSNFFLEFKYVNLGGLSGEKARKMSIEEIKTLPKVQQKFTEAKTQLLDYQKRLLDKYEDALPLQMISVVALGFERVVWEKVISKH